MVMTCSYLPYCLADQSSSGCFTSVLRRLCTVALNRYTISSSGWLSERPKELVLKTRGRQPRPGGSNPPPSAFYSRSEERRVGKECRSGRGRCSQNRRRRKE